MGQLITCNTCNKSYSDVATECIHCGEPNQKVLSAINNHEWMRHFDCPNCGYSGQAGFDKHESVESRPIENGCLITTFILSIFVMIRSDIHQALVTFFFFAAIIKVWGWLWRASYENFNIISRDTYCPNCNHIYYDSYQEWLG